LTVLFLVIQGRYYVVRHRSSPEIKPYHTVYIIRFIPKTIEKLSLLEHILKFFKKEEPFCVEYAMEGVYQTTEKVKLMARKKEPLEIVVNKSLRRVKKIWIKDFEGEIILETKISKVVLVYHRNGLKFF
jgi:hypothetical protein